MRPDVSIVLVSDYAGDDAGPAAAAILAQDYQGTVEHLWAGQEPLAGFHHVPVAGGNSYAAKNAGVRAARAPWAVLVDADCVPRPDWLRRLVETIEAHPEVAAVSGRTAYSGGGLVLRSLALLSRAYLDPGRAGLTRFASNNNACFRRSAYIEHPLPEQLGPFAARIQTERLHGAGWRLWFEPAAVVTHAFEGWAMERDIRRQSGYATIRIRQEDPDMPWAGLLRFGLLSLPVFAAGKLLDRAGDCFRCSRAYGIRWWEQPVLLLLAAAVQILEVPGMVRALRGGAAPETRYR